MNELVYKQLNIWVDEWMPSITGRCVPSSIKDILL